MHLRSLQLFRTNHVPYGESFSSIWQLVAIWGNKLEQSNVSDTSNLNEESKRTSDSNVKRYDTGIQSVA
jgi:hypothetical protein